MPRLHRLLSAFVFFASASLASSHPCVLEDVEEYSEACQAPSLERVEAFGSANADHSSQVLAFAKYSGPLAIAAIAASQAGEGVESAPDIERVEEPEFFEKPNLLASLERELADPESPLGAKIPRSKAIPVLDFQKARVLSKMIAGLVIKGQPHTVYWYIGVPVELVELADFKMIGQTDDYFVVVSETGGRLSLGNELHSKRDFNRYYGLGLR